MNAIIAHHKIVFTALFLKDQRPSVAFRVEDRDYEATLDDETGTWPCEFRGNLACNLRYQFDQCCNGFFGTVNDGSRQMELGVD